ncbi:hypothetical protein [Actinoplanes friuliensis]|uniref:Uncharacterized protein n=1 Tax=Actinoplanes friuliensis DSM 7358 TaxID=1246995 RepID=U5VT93_9ACTN|nr:hypothetical protein [Actinoplanes friuliensis]AGZ40193.1 hypothetical protein AFR_09520 [Actinoplanes friuliensis DSM 7358]
MSRVLGIELRRSAAAGAGLALLVVGVLLLFFAEGIDFSTGWVQLAMTQRLYLAVLWPLALAAGAFQGRRDHRSNVTELFSTTPRPRMHRTMPTLGAMAISVVCAYLVMGIAGGLWIITTAEYFPVTVFVVTAVGALALIAAAWFGLAIGRLLPSIITAPALGVAGLALLLLIPMATRPRGWLALVFSPIYEMNMPGAYATVPTRVSISQTLWLIGLAVAGVLLFASSGWRVRVAALLPLVAGAALAITVMPHQNRYVTDALDPVAQELVCTEDEPRVCVSRVHSALLGEVTPRAREALQILAKLPGAPTQAHEDTTYYPDSFPPRRTDTVLIPVEADDKGHLADPDTVVPRMLDAAGANGIGCEQPADLVVTRAAGSWISGREPVATYEYEDPSINPAAVQLWEKLRSLPEADAAARVSAVRQAVLACKDVKGLLDRSAG